MKAVSKILAGGAVVAALFAAAPASAQYYPGNPYGGYGTGNVVGQVINQVLGGGYGGYGNYGGNSQVVVNQCVNAVQARLARNYNYGGYGGQGAYGGYGNYGGYAPQNYAYGQARVVGISRIEPRSRGGVNVRGVATSGMNVGYGGYGGQQPVDLTFKCTSDYRGYITDIDIDRAQSNYGSNYQRYDPYAAYGYRRY